MATASAGVAAVLSPLCGRDFLSSADCAAEETAALLDVAAQLKSGDRRIDLGNRVLGLIFSKASTRTRVSFQVAMARLGGQTVDLNPSVTQLGRGEPLEDTARVLSRYCDVLAIRTFAQQELVVLCLVATLIGFATLYAADFSRYGRGRFVALAIFLLANVKIVESAVIAITRSNSSSWPLVYLPTLIGLSIVVIMIMFSEHKWKLKND